MKMDAMNEWLLNKGYSVSRSYDSATKEYRFIIHKDGYMLTRYFKYPSSSNARIGDEAQRKFISDMDRDFCQRYCISDNADIDQLLRCPICGCRPNIEGLMEECTITCCGYEFKDARYKNALAKWNQHVKSREKLMGEYMFGGGISNGIEREVQLLNNYMINDAINTAVAYANLAEIRDMSRRNLKIKKVHFNNPATVILWTDGTKTIVKAQDGETYDPEKGMALAIAKKFLGNQGNYYNVFDKWLPKED